VHVVLLGFFFSSRRRHTRFSRDWSSDVCSSDLAQVYKGHYLSDNDLLDSRPSAGPFVIRPDLQTQHYGLNTHYVFNHRRFSYRRSEERRVGKECRPGWEACKKTKIESSHVTCR